MLSDEGDKDADDTATLSELIALAEAGMQAQETEDDTGRRTTLYKSTHETHQMACDYMYRT